VRTPLLLPLLRSQAQGSLLAQLYLHPGSEYSLTDLARLLGVSVKTVHHEADRLTEGGLVRSRRVGNVRLLSADTGHRLTRPLTDLLAATYGPVPVLTDLLSGRSGIAHAYIYGSWAARHAGHPGPVPADLDVLVVGSIDLDDLDEIAESARERLRMDVNTQRISPATWSSSSNDPFITHVRSQPLVELMLHELDQPGPTNPDLEET
jgi:DNA-binding transcriptional ArsR family regulator